MSAYRTVETKLFEPDSQAVADAPAQGEWINAEPQAVLELRGLFRALPEELALSALGQAGEPTFRWRAPLPNDVRPEPGWELEAEGRRYRVIIAIRSFGRTWRLELAAI